MVLPENFGGVRLASQNPYPIMTKICHFPTLFMPDQTFDTLFISVALAFVYGLVDNDDKVRKGKGKLFI